MSAEPTQMPGRRDRVRGLPEPEPAAHPPAASPTAAEIMDPATRDIPTGGPAEQAGHGEEGEGRGASMRRAPRSPRTLRLYDPLYARVGALVRALEDEGELTDRTELIQALLHFELPEDPAGARKLLRRWRRFLAD